MRNDACRRVQPGTQIRSINGLRLTSNADDQPYQQQEAVPAGSTSKRMRGEWNVAKYFT